MRRLLVLTLAVTILLAGILAVSCYVLANVQRSERLLESSQRVLRLESDLRSAIQDMNLSSRGFVLRHNEAFLEKFKAGKKQYLWVREELEALSVPNSAQMSELRRLDSAVADFERISKAMIETGDGSRVGDQLGAMTAIRHVLHGIATREAQMEVERRRVIHRNYLIALSVLMAEAAAAICLVFAAWNALKRYEEENRARLLAECAVEAQRRFLATISHEVRTPLAGVIGLTELLSLKNLGAQNNTAVAAILDSSRRLLQILNSLLDASGIEAGKVKLEYRPFSVRALLGDVKQLIAPDARKKELQISGSCDERIPEFVCGDELRVRQVLLNLCFNAVKFTDDGMIDIGAKLLSQDETSTVVRFTVSDTGSGIPADAQSRIFQPFEQASDPTTRAYGGAGLGLSIAKDLLDLMHGDIGVESEAGRGSTFWFDVPFFSENCKT